MLVDMLCTRTSWLYNTVTGIQLQLPALLNVVVVVLVVRHTYPAEHFHTSAVREGLSKTPRRTGHRAMTPPSLQQRMQTRPRPGGFSLWQPGVARGNTALLQLDSRDSKD